MQIAIDELKQMIVEHYPEATFQVVRSPEDPHIVHLMATIDVSDKGEVFDLIVDRMMQFLIEDGLPLFVIPVRPRERVLAMRRGDEGTQQTLAG
jgi:hypothetical protein